MGRSRRAAGAVVSSPDFIAMMKKACRDFRVGHEWALLEAIHLCLEYDEVAPAWVKVAFRYKFAKVKGLQVTSWDDVFGRPLKKGAQLAAAQRNITLGIPILDIVGKRYIAGESLKKDLFESIAEDLTEAGLERGGKVIWKKGEKIGGTAVWEIYKDAATRFCGGPKEYKKILRMCRPRNSGKI
jgi:hypothetical protein